MKKNYDISKMLLSFYLLLVIFSNTYLYITISKSSIILTILTCLGFDMFIFLIMYSIFNIKYHLNTRSKTLDITNNINYSECKIELVDRTDIKYFIRFYTNKKYVIKIYELQSNLILSRNILFDDIYEYKKYINDTNIFEKIIYDSIRYLSIDQKNNIFEKMYNLKKIYNKINRKNKLKIIVN